MSFVSLEFLVFFVIIFIFYFLTPARFRTILLLLASYAFYAFWNASYIILLVVSTLIDYFVAQAINQTEIVFRRRVLLIISLITNLGILFIFKYFNFFTASIVTTLNAMGMDAPEVTLMVLLPVGISFYTFQSMSYTIDVYNKQLEPETNFIRFATYIAFFPQLVAGPIERAGNMLPQFNKTYRFDYVRVVEGLRLVLWGLFKKVVIGDRVSTFVNEVFAQHTQFDGWYLWVATVFFAIQIYCDFSGYSDIAIGTARILGFDLMQNFRQPYFSQSIQEFWRRWHISLSTWFRDYVYIPLGGQRVSPNRHLFNLMIVFLVSGLWHGANWTFVAWGALHGFYIVVEVILTRRNSGTHKTGQPARFNFLRWGYTTLLVLVAWVFFRAATVSIAFNMVGMMFNPLNLVTHGESLLVLFTSREMLLSFGLIGVLFVVDWLDLRDGLAKRLSQQPMIVRWSVYYILIISVFVAISSGRIVQEFIYFQF